MKKIIIRTCYSLKYRNKEIAHSSLSVSIKEFLFFQLVSQLLISFGGGGGDGREVGENVKRNKTIKQQKQEQELIV